MPICIRNRVCRAIVVAILLAAALFAASCRHQSAPPDPVTLIFIDPEWSHDRTSRGRIVEEALEEFTRDTGIRVNHLPAPESATDQLVAIRSLLRKPTGLPDVFGIDVIWPRILAPDLLDLKLQFEAKVVDAGSQLDDPEMLANFTVDGKLVAAPYHTNVGILYYRTDLLKKYGFREPPATWDELERRALRIQQGERAAGHRDFWGYVWPGAAGEGLTCNAIEWQFDEGGGRIVSPSRAVTVNNPDAIRSWERAANWIGKISPPSVVSYQEWDAINAFKNTGNAAFFRGWASDYILAHSSPNEITTFGATGLPGGSAARVATVGGYGLGVARASAHPREALQLIRFLLLRESKLADERVKAGPPPYPELFDLPPILTAFARFHQRPGGRRCSTLPRPSTVTGEKYDRVSHAYIEAVHSVLAGKSTPQVSAALLEKQLIEITGFPAKNDPTDR
jgi:trehalose/maltose transport system substrate-binding protein